MSTNTNLTTLDHFIMYKINIVFIFGKTKKRKQTNKHSDLDFCSKIERTQMWKTFLSYSHSNKGWARDEPVNLQLIVTIYYNKYQQL